MLSNGGWTAGAHLSHAWSSLFCDHNWSDWRKCVNTNSLTCGDFDSLWINQKIKESGERKILATFPLWWKKSEEKRKKERRKTIEHWEKNFFSVHITSSLLGVLLEEPLEDDTVCETVRAIYMTAQTTMMTESVNQSWIESEHTRKFLCFFFSASHLTNS